jgi:hypothetical protein
MKTSNTVNPTSVTIAPASWDSSADMVKLLVDSRSGYQSVHNWVVSLTSVKALNLFNPQYCKTADKIAEHAKVLGISVSKLKHLCAFRADFDKQATEKKIVPRATWQTMKNCSEEGKQKIAAKNKRAATKTKGLADIGKGKKKAPKKEAEIKADLTGLVGLSLQNARIFISQIMAGIRLHPASTNNTNMLKLLESACELIAK